MFDRKLKWLVLAALLLNAATVALVFHFTRPQQPEPSRPAFKIMEEKLAFDAGQIEKYTTLHRAHRRTTDSLLQEIGQLRKKMYANPPAGSPDSLAQKIGQVQVEIEHVTFQHFQDLRKICSPTQQGKLDSLLFETVQRVTLPGRQNGPPPRH